MELAGLRRQNKSMFRALTKLTISLQSGRSLLQSSRKYVRGVKVDPGVRKRLQLFSEDFVENDPEVLESLESDFMNVHHAHKEFEAEEQQYSRKVADAIVGRKYFKQKGVNFLTWNEKEQIRMLHQNDPNEFTADKLAESFPADPTTIAAIIKNKWHPRSANRVKKHDESVMESWQQFKSGELELDPILAAHLKKFTHRDLNALYKPPADRKFGLEIPKPKSTEFTSIISTCKKYADEPKQIENVSQSDEARFSSHRPRNSDNDSVVLRSRSTTTSKQMPLQEYQKHSPDVSFRPQEEASSVLSSDNQPMMKIKKYEETNVNALKFDGDKKVFESLAIKEHIKIPKKVWKEGQIYKYDDCFYSDDGEFLYRVPGLK